MSRWSLLAPFQSVSLFQRAAGAGHSTPPDALLCCWAGGSGWVLCLLFYDSANLWFHIWCSWSISEWRLFSLSATLWGVQLHSAAAPFAAVQLHSWWFDLLNLGIQFLLSQHTPLQSTSVNEILPTQVYFSNLPDVLVQRNSPDIRPMPCVRRWPLWESVVSDKILIFGQLRYSYILGYCLHPFTFLIKHAFERLAHLSKSSVTYLCWVCAHQTA